MSANEPKVTDLTARRQMMIGKIAGDMAVAKVEALISAHDGEGLRDHIVNLDPTEARVLISGLLSKLVDSGVWS